MKGKQCFDALDIRSLLEKHQEHSRQLEWKTTNPGSPRVNLCKFKVVIKGTPTFPVRGIVQGVPIMGISWLVFIGVLAIVSNKQTKYEVERKAIVQRTHN